MVRYERPNRALSRSREGAGSDSRMNMNDHGVAVNKHCPCTQAKCPIRGNCVLCVQNHIEHKRHLPECMEGILRPVVEKLAGLVELNTSEARPCADLWAEFDCEGFLKRTLDKHQKG